MKTTIKNTTKPVIKTLAVIKCSGCGAPMEAGDFRTSDGRCEGCAEMEAS